MEVEQVVTTIKLEDPQALRDPAIVKVGSLISISGEVYRVVDVDPGRNEIAVVRG